MKKINLLMASALLPLGMMAAANTPAVEKAGAPIVRDTEKSILKKAVGTTFDTPKVSETFSRTSSKAAKASSLPELVRFHTCVNDNAEDSDDLTITFVVYADTDTDIVIETEGYEYESTVPGDIDGKSFSGTVGDSGWVIIKGDPSVFFGIDLAGTYTDEIDLSNWTQIETLDLAHNSLTALDLSMCTALRYLCISDNEFNGDDLVLGTDHPNLMILEMAMIDNFPSSGPQLTNFPLLYSYIAYSTYGFTEADFSNCPEILQISMDCSDVSSLTLGANNSKLLILNIGNSPCTYNDGDFSFFPDLQQLYVEYSGDDYDRYKLTSIDVRYNPDLLGLFLNNNKLSSIDVSKNTQLQSLYLSWNELSEIDLSNNTDIFELMLRRNKFNYATLPDPSPYYYYYYTGQADIEMAYEYKVGDSIDLSSQVMRDGTETTVILYSVSPLTPNEPVQLAPSAYSFEDGVLTLLKAQDNPVYVEFYNSLFESDGLMTMSLNTTQFLVRTEEEYGTPTKRFTFLPSGALSDFYVTVGKADGTFFTSQAEVPSLLVDWGDGTSSEVAPTYGTTINLKKAETSGNNVTVSLLPGYEITGIVSSSNKIVTMNLDYLQALTTLSVQNAELSQVSLLYNKALQSICLNNNSLSSFSTESSEIVFDKNDLTSVEVSNNKLTSVALDNATQIKSLVLSGNQLAAVDLSLNENITMLDLSNNLLEDIDILDLESLSVIFLNDNKLSSLNLPNDTWYMLNIANNLFTLATIPHVTDTHTTGYTYAPQADIQIITKGPGVNLASQLFSQDYTTYNYMNGTTTTTSYTTRFEWFKEDGSQLVEGTDYTVTDGYTAFIDPEGLGKVRCRLSHGAYPDFSGDDSLYTTYCLAAEAPTNQVASFTSTANTEANFWFNATGATAPVFIDWGDGLLLGYEPGEDNTANASAGKFVKVYTYEDELQPSGFQVTCPMADLDISGLTNVESLYLNQCYLDEITLPNAPIKVLGLAYNNLSEIDLSGVASTLYILNLTYNSFSEIELPQLDNLEWLYFGGNNLSDIDLSKMPNLTSLELGENNFEEIDLSPCQSLHQAFLQGNKMSSTNAGDLPGLRVLNIADNRFDFSTLPLPRDQWTVYTYSDQAVLEPGVTDRKIVDLSSQAYVDGSATYFYWFTEQWEFDDDGYVYPDPLVEGTDYTIEDGVTTFLINTPEAYCLMVNSVLPNIYLGAYVSDISKVDDLQADASGFYARPDGCRISVKAEAGARVRIFDAQGRCAQTLTLPSAGSASSMALAPGVYVVTCGSNSAKVMINK